MEPVVRVAALTSYLEVAHELKLNPHALLSEASIDPGWLSSLDRPMPARSLQWLLEESAKRSGHLNFGLRMAELRHSSSLGIVGMLLTHQGTLRDALRTAMQYRQLLNETLAIDIEDDGHTVLIREDVLPVLGSYSRQTNELALGVLVINTCRPLLGKRWHPMRAYFAHAQPPDLSVHRRVFECPLHFDSEYNGITCSSRDFDGPNPLADPTMVRQLEHGMRSLGHLAPDSVVIAVQREVLLLLPVGQATIEKVAGRLRTSVRTLQRQLEVEGQVFAKLLDDVQRELVVRYLENRRYSIKHVATLVGYTDQSAFGRWFKKSFACSPSEWRREAG